MTDQHFRLPQGGRVDRGTVLRFTVDGRELTGHPGDTVASAMLANGIIEVAPSLYRGRPRGIVAAGVEEPNALLQIDGPCSEGMLPATTVELYDGLGATTLSGMGRLDPAPDSAVYDKKYVHTDVLVVGYSSTTSPSRAVHCSPARRVTCGGSPTYGRRSTQLPRSSSCNAPRRSGRTTTTMCWPSSVAPTTWERLRTASPASGCGTSGPAR